MEIFFCKIQKLEVGEAVVHQSDGFIGCLSGCTVHNNTDQSSAVTLGSSYKDASGSCGSTLTSADTALIISGGSRSCHGKGTGKVSGTAGNIGSRYRIGSGTGNCAETVIADSCLHNQGQVMGGGVLIIVRKTGRIGKYGIGTSKFLGAVIHFLDKSIYRAADLFCNLKGNIIGRSQHDCIEALLHGKNFSKL